MNDKGVRFWMLIVISDLVNAASILSFKDLEKAPHV